MLPGLQGPLQEKLQEAREFVTSQGEESLRVVTHNDADGLSAGAILHHALSREGFRVHTRCVRQLEERYIEELAWEKPHAIIFSDLGSGQIEKIESHLGGSEILILDHHEPREEEFSGIEVNAHSFDIDGATELSGSGMAYLFARALSEENKVLAPLAMVGAVGDMQDGQGEFLGINKIIAQEGMREKFIRVEKDLRIFGRQTRPLYKALEYTTEPFLPGLTGSESSCIAFLEELGIPIKKEDDFTMLADLDGDEKKRLANALILKMVEKNVPIKIAESIIGEVVTLIKEEKRTPLRDAREYSTLLNSCGKYEKYGNGIAIALGERGEIYRESLGLLNRHRENIGSCFNWIAENTGRVKDYGSFYAFHAQEEIDENIIGTVTAMVLSSRLLKELKPVIGMAYTEDGEVKVSARANRVLVEGGVDLGKAMIYASEKLGGEGGGHNVAAGGKIKRGSEEEFMGYVKESLEVVENEVQG